MIQTTAETESTRGQVGQGILSLAELKLFVSLHGGAAAGDKVPRWLTEALNPVGHESRQPDYSFSDLVSLIVVFELRSRGMKSWRIKESEAYLRERRGIDRPFVVEELATDGVEVFIPSEEPNQLESTNKGGGQQVHIEALGPALRRIRYQNGYAQSWEPSTGIVLDPNIRFGRPVIAGTRVLAEEAGDLANEFGAESAESWLSLKPKQVRQARQFLQGLKSFQ